MEHISKEETVPAAQMKQQKKKKVKKVATVTLLTAGLVRSVKACGSESVPSDV